MSEYSVNERAEKVVGRRLSSEQEKTGVVILDCPCELGYWCPKCRVEWDETLQWSEYRAFLWCERCNYDYPSALCIRIDAEPDPKRHWFNAGRDDAVRVYLDTIEEAIARARMATAQTETERPAAPPPETGDNRKDLR